MKRIALGFLTGALLLTGFNLQKDQEKIWLAQTTVDKAIAFEKGLGKKSEFLKMNVSLSKSIYPLVDKFTMAKPLIVQRKQNGFLPLYAEYHYSLPDSVVRFICYDWERDKYGNFFDKQEIWKKESKKLDGYNAEYERVKIILVEQLGQPAEQDAAPQKKESERGAYFSRETIWQTEDYYSKLNMIFESMTYRIRWYYYWKK